MSTIVYSIAGGFPPFIVEVVGEAIPLQYRAVAGTYTIDMPECGTYTIRVTDAKDCVDEFTAVCPCSTTTSTTTPIPTTTTTTYEEYPCNFPISFYGTEFITIYDIYIGATTGWITLEYNIFNIPAKIIVEYGGAEVINTTYRGNSSYQTALNTALTALGLPTEVINTDKESIEYYQKTDAGIYAKVYIYSPIAGATIDFRLRCPVDADFDVVYGGYVCIEELATTTTTTTECSLPAGYDSEAMLYYRTSVESGGDFRGTLEETCLALYNYETVGETLYGWLAVSDEWIIGNNVYNKADCSFISEGYHVLALSGIYSVIYISPDGVINSYPDCPTTTTTTGLPATTTTSTIAPTTTTTTTLLPTTTTTTEGTLPLYHITRSGAFYPGTCGNKTYPCSALGLFAPEFIVNGYYEPDQDYADLDYVKITYVSIPSGLDLTYNGSTIQVNDIIYSNAGQWQWALGYVYITRTAEGTNNLTATIKFNIKIQGIQLSEEVTANLTFAGCTI